MPKKLFIMLFFMVLILTGCCKKDNLTHIQFASWGSKSEIEILKPIIKDFETQNPNIKIDFMHIPQNYFQKIHLLFASNMAPDVIFLNNLYLPIYANAGLLEDLTSQTNKDEFYENTPLKWKNKIYAIPRDISNLAIYYNKDIFDKYNVPYPTSDWKFNDFLVIAQKLTHKPDVYGISFEEMSIYYLPYLMSEGGGILSDDLSENIIDTPQSKKGLQFYSDLRKKYGVAPKKYESASATMAQMFLQGHLAMHLSGRWLNPKYKSEAKFRWGVLPFPNGDKGSVVSLDASGWAISKQSKHKSEALKFILFLSDKNQSQKFADSGLIVPARRDVKIDNPVWFDIIKHSKPTPVSVDYNEKLDDLSKKLEPIFN